MSKSILLLFAAVFAALSVCLFAESFKEPGVYIVNGRCKPCTIKKWSQLGNSIDSQSPNDSVVDTSFFIKQMGAVQKSDKKIAPYPKTLPNNEYSNSQPQVPKSSQSFDDTESSFYNGYKIYIEEKAQIIRNRAAFNKWFVGWLGTVAPLSGLQKSTVEDLKQVAANEMSKMKY